MPSGRGLVRALLGTAVSAAALLLVARSVDLAAAWATIRAADARWTVVLVALVVADVLVRTVRWRLLLRPLAPVPFRAALGALLVGYLANNILPARLGEVVRSADLGARTGTSRSAILGTIVVERVLDTLVAVAIAAFAILVLSVRGIVASAVLAGAAAVALLATGIAAALLAHRVPGAARVAALVARRPALHEPLVRLRSGLAVASDPGTMARAIAVTVASWSLAVLAVAGAAQAVGTPPTTGQAALVAAGTTLATAVPAAPGYIGTFELAAVTIAGSVGLPAVPALAFAVLWHVAILVVTSAGGVVALVLRGRAAPGRSSPDGPRPGPPASGAAAPAPPDGPAPTT